MNRIGQSYVCLAITTALFVSTVAAQQQEFNPGAELSREHGDATLLVATRDSSDSARAAADFCADGHADQIEINAAIAALPPVGGTVLLAEGTYDIRANPGTLGGIIINRSNVVLAGRGSATRLKLAANQNTNVVRIIGDRVHHVVVRDLSVDANRAQNQDGKGDPNISHDRFEYCGIKAYCRAPGGPAARDVEHITIRDCEVRNAHRLGIMLEGRNLQVIDNLLGDAGSDSVELLTGPGIIQGNYVEITERTHVAIGTDRANSVHMSNNIVHVRDGGKLDIGFRTWANSESHVINGNTLVVDKGGHCTYAMDLRGQSQTVHANSVRCLGENNEASSCIRVGGGNTIISGNLLKNVTIEINDQYKGALPIILAENVLDGSMVRHMRGKLVANSGFTSDPNAVRVRVQVDRGKDVGQCFGSLFEATSDDEQLTIGAGFLNAYNTRLRADRHAIHFYVREYGVRRKFKVATLPRPNELCGTYLHSRDEQLISTVGGQRTWNPNAKRWDRSLDRSGTGETMRVGSGVLEFGDSEVRFNNRTVLARPDRGVYQLFYYANGYLCFYHVAKGGSEYRKYTDDEDGFSRLVACPWTPEQPIVDLTQATVFNLPIVGETTFAWGQLSNQIVTGSNIGGFYVFEGGSWRTLLEPDIKTSFQLYSTLAFHDRLLMGQYPTGRLFSYDGKQLKDIPNWPPTPEGFSPHAREAQTSTIYGGELLLGVWPWGELWRMDPSTDEWTFLRRMFRHPEPAPDLVHPYDVENRNHPITNLWGQRVTSLIPMGSDLLIGTSAKSPVEWDAIANPFLAPDRWKSYGSVYRFTSPGHLSAPTNWTRGPTTFTFTITSRELAIDQDGVRIAWQPLTGDAPTQWHTHKFSTIEWGQGIYGAASGLVREAPPGTAR